MKFRLLAAWLLLWMLAACSNQVLSPPEIPAPQPSPTPTPDRRTFYQVQQGDTLWDIAKKFDTTVERLIEVNELTEPDALVPGQQLLISDKMTISGKLLPTPTPTPIPCTQGCRQAKAGCKVKAYRARLDGYKLYVLPGDAIYATQQADFWFCREQDARAQGWVHWTPSGPEQ